MRGGTTAKRGLVSRGSEVIVSKGWASVNCKRPPVGGNTGGTKYAKGGLGSEKVREANVFSRWGRNRL
jgi:hypothetical protein